MRKKGFTLIELIAVLVILAILALIVTPLVMNIIRKAKISADKRSIDAYGRSVELAIANYLLDNGNFPTEISQLTIEYSGDEVVCSTTQLNSDSSVYLAGCTVGGRSVEGYTYGKEEAAPTYTAYEVGDEVTYNNVDYYVIENSGANETSVTLLKKTPLTTEEVNQYGGVGTEDNHVNMYVTSNTSHSFYQTARDLNGYGGMVYYSSATCGYNGSNWVYDGCIINYEQSDIKYVVDAWKKAKAPLSTSVRLITFDDLKNNLGFTYGQSGTSMVWHADSSTPSWVYSFTSQWTMTPSEDSNNLLIYIEQNGHLNTGYYYFESYTYLVRPVIVLPKTALN